jgi:hypothetical protein
VAGATLSTLSSILKDYYLPTVQEQMNNEVLFMQRLEPSAEELFGNQAVLAVHKGRNAGIGPAAEGAALPAAGNQQYARATYDLIYLYGRVGVTGPGIAKTASQAGAYLQMLQAELDGIRTDLQKDLARQIYGSGLGNGLIAKCGTTTAANVVVLASAEALLKGHLSIGMIVDIGTSPNATDIATARTITDVNIATPSITISGAAVTTSSSHFVARSGAGAKEITGLDAGSSAPRLAARSATSTRARLVTSYWDNQRLMNAGTPRAISVSLMGQARGLSRINGAALSLIVSSFGLQRALFELLQQNQRFVNTTEFSGGFQALDWQGHPFVADVDHPWGRVNFLAEKDLALFSNRDWHFADDDGNTLRMVSGFDMYEAILRRYINFGARRRNTQLVLGDLTDTTGY